MYGLLFYFYSLTTMFFLYLYTIKLLFILYIVQWWNNQYKTYLTCNINKYILFSNQWIYNIVTYHKFLFWLLLYMVTLCVNLFLFYYFRNTVICILFQKISYRTFFLEIANSNDWTFPILLYDTDDVSHHLTWIVSNSQIHGRQ